MKWISALDLAQWADRVAARTEFPGLIRELITASAIDISEIRFPSGDKGQVRGFDGWLQATGAPPFVPPGRSVWEFGVNASPRSKFASDYNKRVKELSADDRKDMTFVFASPRTWDNPVEKIQDFEENYRKKGDFKDVRYIDGVQLENWLEKSGAVAARHARDIAGRVLQIGARSTNAFWEEYRRRFRPPLTEEVVLAARDAEAANIVTHLLGGPGMLMYQADGADEVAAVAVAAIRKSEPENRAFIEAKTLVVDNDDAGRVLAQSDRYGFVLTRNVGNVAGLLSSVGPTVSGGPNLGMPGQGQAYLNRPSTREMTQAIETMGFEEDAAMRLAVKSGRSLAILERHAPAAGFEPPKWAASGEILIPALLAGGWDSRRDGDMEIVADLAGVGDYRIYEAKIRGLLGGHDAPLDREVGVWKLRAPVDALVNLSRYLGSEHMDALTQVAIRLFSAPPPNIAEERFGVSKAEYSSRIRDGVANTLLMIAVLHEEVGLDIGVDPAARVSEMIAELPGLSDDIRVITSLERQLPMLMEAAPDPLLAALEHMLEGDDDNIAQLFAESGNFGQSSANLPQLLWALETLAWDPRYLRRVALILARLAAVDPGGKSGNRPIGSLRDIFVAWNPGTNATLHERLSVIDSVVAAVPPIGWILLMALLPKFHDSKGPTQTPRYREAGASGKEVLTRSILAETYDAVIDRVFVSIGADVAQWVKLLESFPHFSPDRREQFLQMLAEYAGAVDGDDKIELRKKTRSVIERHSRFRDAKWAMPLADVERLGEILAGLEAVEPMEQARALFDEMSPFGSGDFHAREAMLTGKREVAVGRLFASGGADAILKLAETVRWPGQVAVAASKGVEGEDKLFELIERAAEFPAHEAFAAALSSAMRWQRDNRFDSQFLSFAAEHGWTNESVAMLMLNWPEDPLTWQVIDDLGEAARTLYWKHREPRIFSGSASELARLIEYYLAVDRGAAALTSVYNREDDLEWPLIQRLLAALVKEINANEKGELDDFYVEELFKKLRARADVPPLELAQWEYAYFPLLEHRDHDLSLFELMASDPDFYVSILKDVFIADDADPDAIDPDEKDPHRGTAAYRVLSAFDSVPGENNGEVDEKALDAWVDGVIEAATRQKRLNVIFSHVGRTIAHSPEIDGAWPPRPVTDVIERLQSDDLERGLSIERFNMRGVYSKAMFEGGKQERELAEQYRRWADAQPATKHRTRAMLRGIANGWEADARRADDSAKRDKLQFD